MSGNATILLVDDDPEIREMTSMLLGGAGFEVRTAGSGEEAIYRTQQERPDLVLLDINMPGVDGWETLRLLREDERTQHTPVIMFSVNFELREKLHALQQGAQDYVTKPFDTDGLLRRIREALATAAAERS
jgi:two-component system OmpR family response regulator